MKRMIVTFWLLNLAISMALFVTYRVVITNSNYPDGDFLESLGQIIDLVFNLVSSFIYFILVLLSSFLLFLNLIGKIRNNWYLSLVTFLGVPLFFVVFLVYNVFAYDFLLENSLFMKLVFISMANLLLSTLLFIQFQKKIKTIPVNTYN